MKYAVVSGAASGIGASVKTRLEDAGYTVIGIDLHKETVCADLGSSEGRQSAIDQTLELTGGKIERLVLAAGLGGHLEDGGLVVRVNYFGAIELLDGFKNALSETQGRCVVIGSNSAQMRTDPESDIVRALLSNNENQAMQYVGDSHAALTYGLSKHAVTRAVRRRAAEFGELGITVNVIAPGPTETPMLKGVTEHPVISKSLEAIPIPKKRFGQIKEMTDVIEFMMSDAAEYMQGSVIYVDGGTDAQVRPDAF